ncbi:hypothetical protein [Clostridium disporicum]|uniref:Uncharacterized protein n=1 Tax=Clostridium disporicum TaxID=84024 RepID=A0A174DLS2_9CLOT|nr:hypothetical protein [Clostridium disporicum]CUO26521.1 Uncharacterised protein [Clostridium disporicum]
MINIKEHKEYLQGVIYLNKERFINKSLKENELKELIMKLNLLNITKTNYISINELLRTIENIGVNISTHRLIDLNFVDSNKTQIIYRFD